MQICFANDKLHVVATETDASFRAIACNRKTLFVGGTGSTLLRSEDDGKTWQTTSVCEDTDLDFRDVEVLADNKVLLMSAGPGKKSRLFLSSDRGQSWQCVWVNKHDKGFFNGLAVGDQRVVVVGDPIGETLYLLSSDDSGTTWTETVGPVAAKGEYGFAASGTGIQFTDGNHILIATGGARASVFRSEPKADGWSLVNSGLRHGNQSSGIFSLAIRGELAVAVGGDYLKPDQDKNNAAWSDDEGNTWQVSTSSVPHKACVRFLDDRRLVACGRTGIMASFDSGKTWKTDFKRIVLYTRC